MSFCFVLPGSPGWQFPITWRDSDLIPGTYLHLRWICPQVWGEVGRGAWRHSSWDAGAKAQSHTALTKGSWGRQTCGSPETPTSKHLLCVRRPAGRDRAPCTRARETHTLTRTRPCVDPLSRRG